MFRTPLSASASRSTLLLTALAFALAPAIASAQSATSGAIAGTVVDANGALVPHASIKVTNAATGVERSATTNGSGEYRIPELEPGVYTEVISAPGFQTVQQDIVTVTVGTVSNVSPHLTIGSETQRVEVTDENPLMHTQSNEISTVLDQNTIDNLPINGRRWSDFALLTPGVVSNSDGFGLLSFRGISYLLNNSTVDGADDNQAYFSEARGRTRSSYAIAQGVVQEFQVNTSNYSAEYGRAAGGVINTVTKSGTNKLRGELFFYDRDNGLGGAYNSYTLLAVQDPTTQNYTQVPYKPKDWRKQWGFAVGGPIIKDRIFWFYGYDQSRRNFPGTARTSDFVDMFARAQPLSGKERCTYAGLSSFGAPQFTYTSPDGTFTQSGVSTTANLTGGIYPVGASYQGDFGACALAVAIGGNNTSYQQGMAYYNQGLGVMASFLGPVPRTGDQVINFPKLDVQLTERERLTLQYNRLRWDSPNGVQTQSSNTYGRGSFGSDYVKADFGIARLTSVITNSIVNSALVQYGRDDETEYASNPTPNEIPLLNLPASLAGTKSPARPPDVSIGFGYDSQGFDIGTNPILNRFALPDERRLQGRDDVTWTRGKHTLKFGLDYNKVSDYINNLYNGYGSYSEDWAYNFIGDYLHATTNLGDNVVGGAYTAANHGLYFSISQGFGKADALLTTREYAGYATDDWRITPRLTLTLGARYEYEYVPANPTPNPAVPQTYGQPDDRNNIGPRAGFAWNIYGDSKTVLRGGYGLYYGRIINSNILQTYNNSGGPNSQSNYTSIFPDSASGGSTCAPFFPQVFAAASNASACSSVKGNISFLDSHLQNPQVHEGDLAIEQDLGHNLTIGLTWMGSFGRELNSSSDVNTSRGSATPTLFVVDNTPAVVPNTTGYLTLPHGGLRAPLPDGSFHTVTVYTGNSRINPAYGNILRIASNVNSKYNALAFQVNRRYKNGFSMLSNFTWSHSLDYNPYIGTGVPTFNVLDPNDLTKEYGNSSLDVRRRFVLALTYQPQTHFKGWLDYVAGGWRIAPIFQAQSGLPFTASTTGYPNNTASGFRGIAGTGASANRIDDLRRNQYYRPKTLKADLRVGKNFYFNVNRFTLERVRLEFFAEVFNVANHQNITGIVNTAYAVGTKSVTDPTTGKLTTYNSLKFQSNFGTYNNANSNYTYTPRQLQLAARLHF